MEKMIEVEEGRCERFRASALSPILYNRIFPGMDFIKDMSKMQEHDSNDLTTEDYEFFSRLAYVFAIQGKEPKERKKFATKYPDANAWLDSMNTLAFYNMLPEIVDLFYKNEKQVSEAKNQVPAPPAK